MTTTRQLPQAEWQSRFDALTKEFLRDRAEETVTIRFLSDDLGDQVEGQDAVILGVSFDPKKESLEISLGGAAHRVHRPAQIWIAEDDDGFISTMEVVRDDGAKEILEIRRSAPLARPSASP